MSISQAEREHLQQLSDQSAARIVASVRKESIESESRARKVQKRRRQQPAEDKTN